MKGLNCTSTIAVLRKRLKDADAFERFVSDLPTGARLLCTRRISALEWVPLDQWTPVEEAILAKLCAGDYQKYRELTAEIVSADFSGVYRVFLKVPGPGFVLRKSTTIFAQYFTGGSIKTTGNTERPTQEDPAIVEAKMPEPYKLVLWGVAGAVDAVLALTRAKNPVCRVTGEETRAGVSQMRFAISWD